MISTAAFVFVFYTGWIVGPHQSLLRPFRPLKSVQSFAATDPKRNYSPTHRKEFYYGQSTAPNTTYSGALEFLKNQSDLDLDDEDFQEWVDLISGKPVTSSGKTTTIYVSKSNMAQLVNQLTQAYEPGEEEYKEPKRQRQSFVSSGRKTPPKASEHFEVVQKPPWNFTHVGGYDNIKEELLQCVDLLTNYSLYSQYNVRVPKGLILEGPPGNGKTLLAKGFAGECDVSFIALSGAQFQDKYVGVGATRVRELFDLARQNAPCVVFIDEIDAVGRKRSSEGEGSAAERDSTLNELLVGLDGFQSTEGIFLIGATNRADMLDPALLRPGRIDKRIYIGPPDAATREAILQIHLAGKPYNTDTVSLQYLKDQSAGFSGAQIENWLNEAMLVALRKRQKQMEWEDLEAVMSRVLVGWQPSQHDMTPEMIYRIAVHEMGHAMVGILTKHHSRVSQVLIQLSSPTSPGYTQFEKTATPLYTKEALFEHLIILLAGRIAEEQFFETSTSTGASDDLEKALELAENMVSKYGMGELGVYPRQSEKFKERMDDEIFGLLSQASEIATQWIQETKPAMAICARILVRDSRLSAQQITDVLEACQKSEGSETAALFDL